MMIVPNAVMLVLLITNVQYDKIDYTLVKAERTTMGRCMESAIASNVNNPLEVGNYSVTCSPILPANLGKGMANTSASQ